MSFLDQLGPLLQQYAGGQAAATDAEAHAHYDQITSAVPPHELGRAIGPALTTLPAPDLRDRVSASASAAAMTADQRGSLVQTLLAGFGPQVGSLLAMLGLNPALAQNPSQATPADAGALAAHVKEARPDIFNQAMAVYAQHPTLVKVLGSIAIAKIAQQLTRR
jgi:hypothetical protein